MVPRQRYRTVALSQGPSPPGAVPARASRGHRRATADPFRALLLLCLAIGSGVWTGGPGAVAGGAPAAEDRSAGVFLPAADEATLWRRTVATVSDEWPIERVVEPEFHSDLPRDGLLESAWVEPAGAAGGSWPPRRQRLVVRFRPEASGAWLAADLETQSLADVDGAVGLAAGWAPASSPDDVTLRLAALVSPAGEAVVPLPPLGEDAFAAPRDEEPPWAGSQFPRAARAGSKVLEDYRNFYSCESLVCLTAAFGAGALMANTGFDTTMQGAWMRSVEPTSLGTFFSDCKPIGEGRYALPIFGAAAVTGLVFEGNVAGDVVGEWGSRTLRMFVVGAPPLYAMQWVTGASRPSQDVGSQWHAFADNNGVSGHAFIGAIPFLAAADMVESPLLKGTLYVCSTFVGFSRMTDNAHFPSQVFLGWYLAWASSRAVSATETRFAGMEVRVVPLPTADLGGMAVEARW